MRGWRWVLGCLILLARVDARAAEAGLIKIDGPIGPATADYLARAVHLTDAQEWQCLIVQLDTPGGLLDSTRQMVQSMYSAKRPVVVYVAPSGAFAGSAGVFITLAADVAAMAPNTGMGAAHPVSAGGAEQSEVMKEKLANFATSYIESIAAKRGRNAEWAKMAVRESATITAEAALATNVIDLIAQDLPDLLLKLEARQVDGRSLNTAGAQVREIPMLARERFFQMFWRPEVLFILMLIAVYGIIGEISNPGTIIPGVAGAIALIVALYMMAVLPVNIAGIALLVLAIGLFIAEVLTASFGVLAIGGIVAFTLGALMLFDAPVQAFRLSLWFVLPAALLTAAFFVFAIGAGLRAQRRPVRVGVQTLVGKTTLADTPIDPQGGKVFVEGEYWRAVSEEGIAAGQRVEIIGVHGLTLTVKPKQ